MKKIFTILALATATMAVNAQFVDLGLQAWKGAFAVADIDGDGDLDIVFSGEADNTTSEIGGVFINDGAGNFTLQAGERVVTTGRSGNIQFGDIDGDGDLDVIFAGWGDNNAVKAGIALNNGNGVFTLAAPTAYPILQASKICSAGFADFDMNGLLDYYFFGNNAENCVIYFQQPDGSFVADNTALRTTARYATETLAVGDPIDYSFNEPEVTVIDFDGDHYPDIFINAADLNVANSGEQTQRFSYLFKNDGFGVFNQFAGVEIPYKKGNGTSSWGDVNGDGYPDLLLNGDGFLNSGENNDLMWRVFKNNAGASVTQMWEMEISRQGSMANGSLFVDWDGDGKLDFFTNGWNPNLSGGKQEIALFTGDNSADFTFTRSSLSDTYIMGASEAGLFTADLTGNGKPDLLINGFADKNTLNRRAVGYMPNNSTNALALPAAPTALTARVDDSGADIMVTFSWSAPNAAGQTYNLSLKNTTTGKWLYNPMANLATGKRNVGGKMGNVFHNKAFELYNLPNGNYEWTVQVINAQYMGGAFAETKTFTIGSTGVDNSESRIAIFGANRKIVLRSNSGTMQTARIFSVTGAEITQKTFTGNTEIEIGTGLYIVKLGSKIEKVAVK
ncbi:MAG: VCBS repeat-containing protein [Paludibacter sp.]|jgi:hypothetical protein|nr:VCBS repeat-containing protein [Paludibacter sp.]